MRLCGCTQLVPRAFALVPRALDLLPIIPPKRKQLASLAGRYPQLPFLPAIQENNRWPLPAAIDKSTYYAGG